MALRVENIPAAEVSRGYVQATGATVTSVFTLTAPAVISGQAANVQYARLYLIGAGTLRYRCDGVNPTVSTGMPMTSGMTEILALSDFSKFVAIGSANTLELNVEFFADP